MKEEDKIINGTQEYLNKDSGLETRDLILFGEDNVIELYIVKAFRKHYSYVFYITKEEKVFLMKSKANNMFGFGYKFQELYRYGNNMPNPLAAELYKKELYTYIKNEIRVDIRVKKLERILMKHEN